MSYPVLPSITVHDRVVRTGIGRSAAATLSLCAALVIAAAQSGAATLTWTGAADTNWDTTTANWTGYASVYAPGDAVTFSDCGVTVANTNVCIQPAGVTPSSLTISNSTATSFAFAGGGIGGGAALLKAGPGTATFNTGAGGGALAFSGGTEIDGGAVQWIYSSPILTNSFGSAAITLSGGVFGFRAGSTPANQTSVLTNKFVVNNAGTIATDSSSGKSFMFAGDLALNGDLSFGKVDGGSGNGPGANYAGTIALDQSSSGLRRLTLIGGAGFGPTVSGNIVDGAGPSANILVLRSGNSGNGNAVTIAGANNTYAHGTVVTNPVSGSQAIIVDAKSQLGTGWVLITTNATLQFNNDGNLSSAIGILTNNGTLIANYASAITASHFVLTGAGNLTKTGGGALLWTNAQTFLGTTLVNGGLLDPGAVTNLSRNNLNLGGGALVLGGTGSSWADFTAAFTNCGAGARQWQISGGGGGFAARGADLVISGLSTGALDRSLTLGSSLQDGGALYAGQAVIVSNDITLSAASDRTWSVAGQCNQYTNVLGLTTWLVAGPANTICGRIRGGAPGRSLFLNGFGSGKSLGLGGMLRLSNPANDYVATNVLSGGGGNLVVIASDDGALGDAANPVVLATDYNGSDCLLLFEDAAGAGKTFGRTVTINTATTGNSMPAYQAGVGSFAGNVTFTGTVNRVDTNGPNATVFYAHGASRLTLDNATFAYGAGASLLQLRKLGTGELTIGNLTQVAVDQRTQAWVLVEGALATTQSGQLQTAGGVAWNNLAHAGNSQSNGSNTSTRVWAVRANSQTYTNMTSGSWSGQFTINVDPGVTLTTADGVLAPQYAGAAADATPLWDMIKTGPGTWVYANGLVYTNKGPGSGFTGGGRCNNVRVDQGTFDVSGEMGNGGITLNGGTVLSGTTSPFTGDCGGLQRLLITAAGGKIGISDAATDDVIRTGPIESWDQSAPSTLTLAALDDLSLIFKSPLPDIAAGTTLLIEHDGSGEGVVQIQNSNLTLSGTLGGSGTLRLLDSGTGMLIVSNGVLDVHAGQTLVIEGHLQLGTNRYVSGSFSSADGGGYITGAGSVKLDPCHNFPVRTATYLNGGTNNDYTEAVEIAPDGTVVVGGTLNGTNFNATPVNLLGGGNGAIMRFNPSGTQLLGITRLGAIVDDLDVNRSNGVIAAVAGTITGSTTGGVLVILGPQATNILWQADLTGGKVTPVDANGRRVSIGSDGTVAVLNNKQLSIYSAAGALTGTFTLWNTYVTDVCVDPVSRHVFVTGWDNKRLTNSLPVGVTFLYALDYTASWQWGDWGWPGTNLDVNLLAADSNGYRLGLGRDGYLYYCGESSGGNSIFLKNPTNLDLPGNLVAYDLYNTAVNLTSADITYYAKIDPQTGAVIHGQFAISRLPARPCPFGNTVDSRAIAADAAGFVYVGGCAYYQVDNRNLNTVDSQFPAPYFSGNPFLLIVRPDFLERVVWTVFSGPGNSTNCFVNQTRLRGIGVGQTNAAFVASAQGPVITSTNAIQPTISQFPTNSNTAGYLVVFDAQSGQLPVVTIAATASNASPNGTSGQFTIMRNAAAASALAVQYAIGGTASNGVDYLAISNVVTIAAGSSDATVTIVPLASPALATNQTVTLQLMSGNTYLLGVAAAATVTIAPALTAFQAWQIQYFGSTDNPQAAAGADPLGKGMGNFDQFVAGLDPTNAASAFKIVAVSNQPPNVAVCFRTTSTGRVYRLLCATNLAGGAWTNLPGAAWAPGEAGQMSLSDTNAAAIRFYRIQVELP